jgi:hypothetical protein
LRRGPGHDLNPEAKYLRMKYATPDKLLHFGHLASKAVPRARGQMSDVRSSPARNWEVRFAFKNGHRLLDQSGPFRPTSGPAPGSPIVREQCCALAVRPRDAANLLYEIDRTRPGLMTVGLRHAQVNGQVCTTRKTHLMIKYDVAAKVGFGQTINTQLPAEAARSIHVSKTTPTSSRCSTLVGIFQQ